MTPDRYEPEELFDLPALDDDGETVLLENPRRRRRRRSRKAASHRRRHAKRRVRRHARRNPFVVSTTIRRRSYRRRASRRRGYRRNPFSVRRIVGGMGKVTDAAYLAGGGFLGHGAWLAFEKFAGPALLSKVPAGMNSFIRPLGKYLLGRFGAPMLRGVAPRLAGATETALYLQAIQELTAGFQSTAYGAVGLGDYNVALAELGDFNTVEPSAMADLGAGPTGDPTSVYE